MRAPPAAIAAVLVVAVSLAVACDDGGNGRNGDGGATATPGAETPATPSTFDDLRGALLERLDAFGVNIGAVPPDVRAQILGLCRQLEQFVDEDTVDELCGAVERAMEQNDPGLIDLVIEDLAALEPE